MNDWHRLECDGVPVYLNSKTPNWFVPNRTGDELIKSILSGGKTGPQAQRFLSRMPEVKYSDYSGRADLLGLENIKELWFHITNRCNAECSHCLFSSSPDDADELSADDILKTAFEAYGSGSRLFVLTGGEPLVHPEIKRIVKELLSYDGANVVMLTNAYLIEKFLDDVKPDMDRFHIQISLDGIGETNDAIRGQGSFGRLTNIFGGLKRRGAGYTLSMCVTRSNVHQMPDMIDLASEYGAANVHFMWYFIKGRGQDSEFARINDIYEGMRKAYSKAQAKGVSIDNIEALKTQIFAPSGTIHDGGTAGWESLAVGPDNRLYPSAVLVGTEALATDMQNGITKAWRESPVLNDIRKSTSADCGSLFRFITGGGDIDHSYTASGTYVGGDPYEELYEKLAIWLIAEEVKGMTNRPEPEYLLRMGEILISCGAHGKVALAHSNCLLGTADNDSITTIKNFYSAAVKDAKKDILNPVCYDPSVISHIPEKFRFRGYGCGSPVNDAGIKKGDTVADLGCGSGVECFIASALTGKTGQVIGVDMLDPMLNIAKEAQPQVAKNLGYSNVDFRKGYLESLPADTDTVDVVTSNCVMNLSVNKRRSYAEIFRILKPGGRLVISDVVAETEPDPAIRNNETLKGECIAGALTIKHLMALLEETGFEDISLVKRFFYREVQGHPFFSLTFTAAKPAKTDDMTDVIYRGPLPYIVTDDGTLLEKGIKTSVSRHRAESLGEQIFILDEQGNVTNIQAVNTCACYKPADPKADHHHDAQPDNYSGCMVCGSPLVYDDEPKERVCEYCGGIFQSNAACGNGHFVCDSCHVNSAKELITNVCLTTKETDMIRLMEQIRKHPSVHLHGPEHHFMVPAIILATYRNLGGNVTDDMINTAVSRGSEISGGFCGFMGICGAALGVGIAFSLIMNANPMKPGERRDVQTVTNEALRDIACLKAARCCQRDCYLALMKAAELSADYLPIKLEADYGLVCKQMKLNKECIGRQCVLHPLYKKN